MTLLTSFKSELINLDSHLYKGLFALFCFKMHTNMIYVHFNIPFYCITENKYLWINYDSDKADKG